jgi:hypothetical protein
MTRWRRRNRILRPVESAATAAHLANQSVRSGQVAVWKG